MRVGLCVPSQEFAYAVHVHGHFAALALFLLEISRWRAGRPIVGFRPRRGYVRQFCHLVPVPHADRPRLHTTSPTAPIQLLPGSRCVSVLLPVCPTVGLLRCSWPLVSILDSGDYLFFSPCIAMPSNRDSHSQGKEFLLERPGSSNRSSTSTVLASPCLSRASWNQLLLSLQGR